MTEPKKKPNPNDSRWTAEDYVLHGYRRIGLRLPEATLEKLERMAKKAKMSRAKLLVKLIASY